jgi:two-component system, OmpR family, phosphate regulon response regulator PhoB
MKPLILIVDDEDSLVEILRYNLERAGFEVTAARDGEEALTLIAERAPDLVVLDWMLPHLSGIEVCRQIRRGGARAIPIIMLTARSEEADKVRALTTGADDYLTKPFSPGELAARIQAVLRRTRPALLAENVGAGDVQMDLASHRVFREGRAVSLRPVEFRLLRILIEHPGRVFSREQLLDAVWTQDAEIEPRTVDVHVRRLRKALNAGGGRELIRTVRAAGYAFEPAGVDEVA